MQNNRTYSAAPVHAPGMLFKAVVFDMDGTLVNSTASDYLAWKKLFADYGQPFVRFSEYLPLLGIRSREVIQTYLHLNGEALEQALQRRLQYFTEIVASEGVQPMPHAVSFLQSLKATGVKTALATSSRKEKMALVMQVTGLLPYFDVVVTGEEVSRGKPFPDIFLRAAERLQLSPQECLVIEDAPAGVQAAKNAMMTCVAITTTHAAAALHQADYIIHSFARQDFGEWCAIIGSVHSHRV